MLLPKEEGATLQPVESLQSIHLHSPPLPTDGRFAYLYSNFCPNAREKSAELCELLQALDVDRLLIPRDLTSNFLRKFFPGASITPMNKYKLDERSMHIKPIIHEPHQPREPLAGQRVGRPQPDVQQNVEATDSASGSSLLNHVRAPEITEVSKSLREVPEVRTQLVQDVAVRIASGEYLTEEAAQKTAAIILDLDN